MINFNFCIELSEIIGKILCKIIDFIGALIQSVFVIFQSYIVDSFTGSDKKINEDINGVNSISLSFFGLKYDVVLIKVFDGKFDYKLRKRNKLIIIGIPSKIQIIKYYCKILEKIKLLKYSNSLYSVNYNINCLNIIGASFIKPLVLESIEIKQINLNKTKTLFLIFIVKKILEYILNLIIRVLVIPIIIIIVRFNSLKNNKSLEDYLDQSIENKKEN